MASYLANLAILFVLLPMISSGTTIVLGDQSQNTFSRSISPMSLGLKREKLSHLHFYFQDILSEPNATSVLVAKAAMTNQSLTNFGAALMFDDALTKGPERESKPVGRAQGMYAFASQTEMALLMAMNFVFTEGKYNGSTLSILGRNDVFSPVRELPVLGGSGLFRFARGYAQARTHTFDVKTGNACIEYNVYVYHY